jgi:hypothetical protein
MSSVGETSAAKMDQEMAAKANDLIVSQKKAKY